jgi:uncharacterized membrane protein YfcA
MLESWMLVAVALGLGAMVKGATGMGLPMTALPILATAFDLPRAASIVIVPVVVTNVWQMAQNRASSAETGFLTPMLGAGLFGMFAGTSLMASLPKDAMSLTLGLVVAGYIALRLSRPLPPLGQVTGRRLAPFVGFLAGGMQGATGLSGPVGVPFIHAMRLSRGAHLFAVSAMFLLFSVAQFVALWMAGLLDWGGVIEGTAGLVPVALMMPVGSFVGSRFTRRAFDAATLSLLAVIAVTLILSAF